MCLLHAPATSDLPDPQSQHPVYSVFLPIVSARLMLPDAHSCFLSAFAGLAPGGVFTKKAGADRASKQEPQ